MNQIAILPAGCLVSSKDIIFSNEQHIVYASNLALYVLNAQTFILEKIIAVSERTIASIAVSPHDHNMLVATGRDGFLSLWKLNEEELVSRSSVQADTSFLLAWDPFNPKYCAVLMNVPNMRLLLWDLETVGKGLIELFTIKNPAVHASVIRWNSLTPGLLAAGCNNGWVILFQTSTRNQKCLTIPDRSVPVVDVQWDRLSAIYLLVAYQTFISLWDTETLTEVHTFDKQPGGIAAIAWMDWTVGNFVSANSKNGYLRLWNASQRQPLESIRVAAGGLVTVYFGMGTKRAICACLDGSIVVYHMVKMQMEYCSAAGHNETIFDCTFSPMSPDVLATASYDGTVKLWNVPDLSLTRTLRGSKERSIIYSCDFSPRGNMIAASNSLGNVYIWDAQCGNEVARYLHHSKPVYCVAWNKLNDNLIASVSGDCTLVVIGIALYSKNSSRSSGSSQPLRARLGDKPLGSRKLSSNSEEALDISDIKLKFLHPGAVYGCAWSTHCSTILATCCIDSNVRVFDCAQHGKSVVLYMLAGHISKVFLSSWSPLLPGVLASGSDDATILVWNVNLEDNAPAKAATSVAVPPVLQLRGHTSNIRALAWSNEIKTLLISGSWDSTIRLWDVQRGVCLKVVQGKRKRRTVKDI
jgi:WD repeat-containing protein 17